MNKYARALVVLANYYDNEQGDESNVIMSNEYKLIGDLIDIAEELKKLRTIYNRLDKLDTGTLIHVLSRYHAIIDRMEVE